MTATSTETSPTTPTTSSLPLVPRAAAGAVGPELARRNVVSRLDARDEHGGQHRARVRINGFGTPWREEDLRALAGVRGRAGVMLATDFGLSIPEGCDVHFAAPTDTYHC